MPARRGPMPAGRATLGPEDTSVLQILGKLAAAGTLTVRHVLVEYLDV